MGVVQQAESIEGAEQAKPVEGVEMVEVQYRVKKVVVDDIEVGI